MNDRQRSSDRGDDVAANTDRKAYPKDCPNCGLWLTAESMDCPRCMTKLPHESSAEQKREQALEAVRRAEEAGHTFHDQPMRAPSAATPNEIGGSKPPMGAQAPLQPLPAGDGDELASSPASSVASSYHSWRARLVRIRVYMAKRDPYPEEEWAWEK